jgi:hypothetical protein
MYKKVDTYDEDGAGCSTFNFDDDGFASEYLNREHGAT